MKASNPDGKAVGFERTPDFKSGPTRPQHPQKRGDGDGKVGQPARCHRLVDCVEATWKRFARTAVGQTVSGSDLRFVAILERAKGFEPSTPTLARFQNAPKRLSDPTPEPYEPLGLLTLSSSASKFVYATKRLHGGILVVNWSSDCHGCQKPNPSHKAHCGCCSSC